jgi:hypothetical protein
MKLFLGLILSSFVALSALAQQQKTPVAQGQQPESALPEHPPTPQEPPMENPKDPHAGKETSGAIIRKGDASMTKQPAKSKKAKKMEKKTAPKAGEKKAAPVAPAPGQSVD